MSCTCAIGSQLESVTSNFSGNIRYGMLHGRKHLIAPLTLIVPGVLNGSKGPLLYPMSELRKNPSAWNGMPIVVYHPRKDGKPVSARDPDVLNAQGIGTVFNTECGDKLTAEGWFDVEKTKQVDPRVLANLEASRPTELSTGLFTDNEDSIGVYNGAEYEYVARNHRPDHLAILPDEIGACSIQDGCGVLVNELAQEILNEGRFEEGKHKRDKGKFSSKGGSSSAGGGGGAPSFGPPDPAQAAQSRISKSVATRYGKGAGSKHSNFGTKGHGGGDSHLRGDKVKVNDPKSAYHGKTGKIRYSNEPDGKPRHEVDFDDGDRSFFDEDRLDVDLDEEEKHYQERKTFQQKLAPPPRMMGSMVHKLTGGAIGDFHEGAKADFMAKRQGQGIEPGKKFGYDVAAELKKKQTKKPVANDCGIGPNGFEPGNKCAKGGGGIGQAVKKTAATIGGYAAGASVGSAVGQIVGPKTAKLGFAIGRHLTGDPRKALIGAAVGYAAGAVASSIGGGLFGAHAARKAVTKTTPTQAVPLKKKKPVALTATKHIVGGAVGGAVRTLGKKLAANANCGIDGNGFARGNKCGKGGGKGGGAATAQPTKARKPTIEEWKQKFQAIGGVMKAPESMRRAYFQQMDRYYARKGAKIIED